MKKNNIIIFFLVFIITFAVDFFSKNLAEIVLADSITKINFIPEILSFEKVYNTGGAFSILQGNIFLLSAISAITLIVIVIYIFRENKCINKIETGALALIAGGALGNLYDRIFFGYVVDFIQLDFINFPIFNFADVFINIGVIILLISVVLKKHE